MSKKLSMILALTGVLLVWSVPCIAATYTIIDLGTLDGDNTSYAYGINEAGHVVGYSRSGSPFNRSFLYKDGVMIDLLGFSDRQSKARAINDHGQVVGYVQYAPGKHYHAFIYSNGVMTDFGPAGGQSFARDINNSDLVVGSSHDKGFPYAFIYDSARGTMTDISYAISGDYNYGDAINETGQVVGYSYGRAPNKQSSRGYIYTDGTSTNLNAPVPEGLHFQTWTNDINESAQIAGQYYHLPSTNRRACIWENNIPKDLGTLGGAYANAWAINNLGQAVGDSDNEIGDGHAFIYTNNTMFDLNDLIPHDSGWILTKASDINDSGQIAGNGVINGQERAFLIIPIPEQATLLLDIKPGGCPNPLNTNTKGKGRLPVSILGTDSFDVSEIDPDSISIAGTVLAQKDPSIEDVSAPVGNGNDCTCQEGPDGHSDLVIHFSRREIIQTLGLDTMESGTVVPITVEGNLLDGTPFEATDCVTLVGRKD